MRLRSHRSMLYDPTRRRGAESDVAHATKGDQVTTITAEAEPRRVVSIELLLRIDGIPTPLPDSVASSNPELWHYWLAVYDRVLDAVAQGSPCVLDLVPVRESC